MVHIAHKTGNFSVIVLDVAAIVYYRDTHQCILVIDFTQKEGTANGSLFSLIKSIRILPTDNDLLVMDLAIFGDEL